MRGRTWVAMNGVALVLVGFLAGAARGDDTGPLKVKGEVPADHVELKSALGGAYFVAKPLKERYDKLLSALQAVQADLDAERIDGSAATEELESIQKQLKELRAEIEEKKVLVAPLKVHRQSVTTTFELGPQRLLVITADRLRVEGWDGPNVKCVLEKTVLGVDGQPVDEGLAGLKVVHRHGPAPDLVGKTAADREAEEQAFLASPDGQKLTAQQRQNRARFVSEIAASFDLFHDFQGQEIDTVEIEGLTHEQGNRWINMDFPAKGGGGYFSGAWQRSATLTVSVPASRAVALRGCLEGLDVHGVRGAVLLTASGSHDRDYDGKFEIRDVQGALTVENAPLDVIEKIKGNVTIRSTTEMVNTGTHYDRSQRTLYNPAARTLACRGIDGDLTAWFVRSNLTLEGIAGRVDVRNEFGDTTLVLGAGLAEKAHRVISEAGRVEVRGSAAALKRWPVMALTNCGTVRTNAEQELLRDVSFTVGRDAEGVSRDWRGVVTGSDQGPMEFMARIERVAAALAGAERKPGLDLISRGGTLRVTVEGQ